MHELEKMKVVVVCSVLLATLRENLERHVAIMEEARKGYIAHARGLLTHKLNDLEKGKASSLTFHVSPPRSHEKVYETAIRMLELHQHEHIELTADQVRNLVMDKWDWMTRFLLANSGYSDGANKYAEEQGVAERDE